MILRVMAASALVASVVLLSGCLAPAPEPTPTPEAVFASEEEAFAAAEETYRAYVDAVNARWASEQSSPAPESFLVGEALEVEIDTSREFAELGISIVGESEIEHIDRVDATPVEGDVVLEVCLNSRGTAVLNAAGEDVTPVSRAPLVLTRVDLATVGEVLLIERSTTVKEDGC